VLSGTTEVYGVDTKALHYSQDNITEYFTSDSEGIRLHRLSDPRPGEPSSTFNPPLIMAEPTPEIGSYFNISSGCTAQTIYPDIQADPFQLSCNYGSQVVALETIEVPAGTYDTVKLYFSLRIFGTLPTGTITDETVNQTLWVAQHIGPVKQSVSVMGDSTQTRTAVLTGTNVGSPEPCKPAPKFMPWLPLLLE
jgi:hypothetical protein